MTDLSLTILNEVPEDAAAIERLHERTFGPGRYARTAYRIREGVTHDPALSFTARIGTLLVGSVRLSPVTIGETRAWLLGPLTVEPPLVLPFMRPRWCLRCATLRGINMINHRPRGGSGGSRGAHGSPARSAHPPRGGVRGRGRPP